MFDILTHTNELAKSFEKMKYSKSNLNAKMKQLSILLIGCMLMLSSCGPKISTTIAKNYSSTDYREEVRVFGLQDPIPTNFEELGIVKIGDTGFSTNCAWEFVIDKAKIEARKVGGNALKITEHTPPSLFGSSCHRITAKILKVDNFDNLPPANTPVDSTLVNADYALLHFYRNSGVGALINYDLHLGDTILCRGRNKWKKTIKVKKDGLNTLWAKTESKEELPINIKMGNEYYIRCSLTMGLFVGRPKLELVDSQTGRFEFESIKPNKEDK